MKISAINYGEISIQVGNILKLIGNCYNSQNNEKKKYCYENYLEIVDYIYGKINSNYQNSFV